MATYAVEVKKAVKEFKETKALDDVTLSFESSGGTAPARQCS